VTIDEMISRLEAMVDGSEAGTFAANVAQQLRSQRGSVVALAARKTELEAELRETRAELAEVRKQAAGRKGEIERQLVNAKRAKKRARFTMMLWLLQLSPCRSDPGLR
jgi:septal ring factor EnvC (AmiA/AmiB activator)